MSTVAVIDGGMSSYKFPIMAFHHHVGERISSSGSLTLDHDQKFSCSSYTFKQLVYFHAQFSCSFTCGTAQVFSVGVWEYTDTVYSTL